MSSSRPVLIRLLLVGLLAGPWGCGDCGGAAPEGDGGSGGHDAGMQDGGTSGHDAGAPDAGQGMDAGGPVDAGLDAGLPDAGHVSTITGGHCDVAPPAVAQEAWQHPFATALTIANGAPNHRVRDVVMNPGDGAILQAHFTYGITDKDLEDEKVEVQVQTCPGWVSWGTLVTDGSGYARVAIPGALPPGDYRVRFVVLGDGTTAEGFVGVWPKTTQILVTDIDGTLTTSDWEAVAEVILGTPAEMYTDANTVMQTWAAKDYRIFYLTARVQLLNRYTRSWLTNNQFPFGPKRLLRDNETSLGHDAYKLAVIQDLITRLGFRPIAAYGNADTDITAYDGAGIPKADTYIIGPNAGNSGTVPVSSYTQHLPVIGGYPDAGQP